MDAFTRNLREQDLRQIVAGVRDPVERLDKLWQVPIDDETMEDMLFYKHRLDSGLYHVKTSPLSVDWVEIARQLSAIKSKFEQVNNDIKSAIERIGIRFPYVQETIDELTA